jgi:hypothetical protein
MIIFGGEEVRKASGRTRKRALQLIEEPALKPFA